jgi:hypothetical protein
VSGIVDKLRGLFGRAEDIAEGGEPVTTPAPGTGEDPDRETSTNAQLEGAAGEPYDDA